MMALLLSELSQMYEVGNVDNDANFVFPCICCFLLYSPIYDVGKCVIRFQRVQGNNTVRLHYSFV